MVHYKNLRFHNLNSPQYAHVLLLLYWPIYFLFFWLMEWWTARDFTYIHCPLDDIIPFCEYFIIPYHLWFFFILFIVVYSFFFEVPVFKKYMWFIILTYTAACLIYFVFPNAQGLRPTTIETKNVFTALVQRLYRFDTNTNVCPSLHVIGSVAVCNAALHSKKLSHPAVRALFVVLTVMISISTVFLKQHSVIDLLAALLVCAAAYPFVYGRKARLGN